MKKEIYNNLPKAVCIYEPNGEAGLEGFNRGDEYKYEIRKDKNGKDYYRVYHDENYYEVCGPKKFKKFFKKINNMNEAKDKIKGGLSDKLTAKDIADKFNIPTKKVDNQLKKGMEVEKEHTKDESMAKEIAKDHVSEIPDYYDRLDKMEKEAKKEYEDIKESTIALIKRLLRDNIH